MTWENDYTRDTPQQYESTSKPKNSRAMSARAERKLKNSQVYNEQQIRLLVHEMAWMDFLIVVTT